MDHKYANSNSIFGIYIHELAYIPIFKAFAHFLAELLTFVPLVPLMAQVPETHIDVCISSEISSHNFQSLYENMIFQARLQSFPCIYMCLCHLCHKWHKWHTFVYVNNSARKVRIL